MHADKTPSAHKIKKKGFFFPQSKIIHKKNNYPTILTATILVCILWDFLLAHKCPHQHFFLVLLFFWGSFLLCEYYGLVSIMLSSVFTLSASRMLSIEHTLFPFSFSFTFSTWIVWDIPKSSVPFPVFLSSSSLHISFASVCCYEQWAEADGGELPFMLLLECLLSFYP